MSPFLSVELLRVSSSTPSLGSVTEGVLRVAGYVKHVRILSDRHWVVVVCDLFDHGGVLGVGEAELQSQQSWIPPRPGFLSISSTF